jgi:hypothetical protein
VTLAENWHPLTDEIGIQLREHCTQTSYYAKFAANLAFKTVESKIF